MENGSVNNPQQQALAQQAAPNNASTGMNVLPSGVYVGQATQAPVAPTPLEDQLAEHRAKWLDRVTQLNDMMKTMPLINDMMNTLYSTRQEAVDYYHSMQSIILKNAQQYKKLVLDRYNFIKMNGYNNMRIGTDAAINKIVDAEFSDQKIVIEQLQNHNSYIKETIGTLDNMIYGISNKVKICEILNGLNIK